MPQLSADRPGLLRVLAVFCNPKGTDALRLQAEQRILQRCLPPSVALLQIQPAATLDDLQQALLMHSFDVIHFSGHGCIDAPLVRLLRQVLKAQRPDVEMRAEVQQCVQPAVNALKHWLGNEAPLEPDGPALRLTLHPIPGDARASIELECSTAMPSATPLTLERKAVATLGNVRDDTSCDGHTGPVRLRLTQSDFAKHRVGSLAFETTSGAQASNPMATQQHA